MEDCQLGHFREFRAGLEGERCVLYVCGWGEPKEAVKTKNVISKVNAFLFRFYL